MVFVYLPMFLKKPTNEKEEILLTTNLIAVACRQNSLWDKLKNGKKKKGKKRFVKCSTPWYLFYYEITYRC